METILKKIAVERLASVLKEYVVGLDEDKLQMDSDKGEIRLTSLRLKEHDLPGVGLLLKGGYIQTLSLRVPWKRLKKESVVVTVDQVFLVLGARAVTGARAAPSAHPALESSPRSGSPPLQPAQTRTAATRGPRRRPTSATSWTRPRRSRRATSRATSRRSSRT